MLAMSCGRGLVSVYIHASRFDYALYSSIDGNHTLAKLWTLGLVGSQLFENLNLEYREAYLNRYISGGLSC